MGALDTIIEQGPLPVSLGSMPVGVHALVVRVNGDRDITRRLLSLGLRVGSEVVVLQRRGRSVVVANGAGTRVALGATIAEKVLCRGA